MSEDDPKPGVVIDVKPDDEIPAEPAPEQPATEDGGDTAAARPSPNRTGKLALILAIIAILCLVGAGIFAQRYWTEAKAKLDAELAAMQTRIDSGASGQKTLKQSLDKATTALAAQEGALDEQRDLLAKQRLAVDEAKTAFVDQEQRLADENVRLQEREAELRAAVADVHRRVGRSGTQWIIAEVEYLLRIANNRLILAGDTGSARAALEIADQRLRDTKDPGWAGVRAQIARDIAKLSAFEPADSAGMSARLAAMIEQVPQLKLARATVGPERTLPQQVAREPGERSWNTLANDMWSGFKDAVRIRDRGEPVQAMLPPEHEYFLYENLKLNLEAARLALAGGDQALFRVNLDSAAASLSAHFEPGDGTTKALTEGIQAMQDVELTPTLPDVSQSLRTLLVRMKLVDDVVSDGAVTAPAGQAESQ